MSLWTWLTGWKRRRPLVPVEVILYTRRGCHLCDDAHAQLEDARHRWSFRLSLVDVDTDPGLVAEHGGCVPVVAINGRIRFRGRINEVLLERTLRGEQRTASS